VAGEGAAGVDDRRSMRLGFGAAAGAGAVAVVVANDGVEDGAA
jgi:hypothetical protein